MFRKSKILFFIPFIASCSASMDSTTTTLSTLVKSTTSTYLTSDTYESSEFQFMDDFYYYFGDGYVDYDDSFLIDTGYLWCYLMDSGMTHDDVVERINEGAENINEIKIHTAIIKSAVVNLCENNYSVWYN